MNRCAAECNGIKSIAFGDCKDVANCDNSSSSSSSSSCSSSDSDSSEESSHSHTHSHTNSSGKSYSHKHSHSHSYSEVHKCILKCSHNYDPVCVGHTKYKNYCVAFCK